jgi:hypothetical protein
MNDTTTQSGGAGDNRLQYTHAPAPRLRLLDPPAARLKRDLRSPGGLGDRDGSTKDQPGLLLHINGRTETGYRVTVASVSTADQEHFAREHVAQSHELDAPGANPYERYVSETSSRP